jgi:hypothetical protein
MAVIPVPKTSAVPGLPTVQTFPAAGPAAPPDSAITSPVTPGARCGTWYAQSDYVGQATGSTWWEYRCSLSECEGQCNADATYATWNDFYYWDGARAVFYGEYETPHFDGWVEYGCWYWWDQTSAQWYELACEGTPPPENIPPTASFTVTCDGLTCSFDASSSSDPDGTIGFYSWYFGDWDGDGDFGRGSGQTVQHTYLSPGSRTVSLSVVDNLGGSSQPAQQLVTVEAVTSTTMAPPAATTTTTTIPLAVPGAPRSVSARPVVRTAEVRFDPPLSDGGSPVTSYAARCSSNNGGLAREAQAPASPIKVLSLSGGKTYTCTVRATNAVGAGPSSAPTAAFRVPR